MQLARQYEPKEGLTALVKRGRDEIRFLDLGILWLPAGKAYRSSSAEDEVALVLLGGLANAAAGEKSFNAIGGRRTVFEGRATTLFIPPATKFRLEAVSDLEVAVIRAPSDQPGEPVLIGPEQVAVQHRGADALEGDVHRIIDVAFPARRLLVGETFNPPGQWSSYPPHTHVGKGQADNSPAEGLFFFKLNPPQGFGLQRIYSPERNHDETIVVTNDLAVKLPWGHHPVVAAPGYTLYYLWALAGESRTLSPRYDPTHA